MILKDETFLAYGYYSIESTLKSAKPILAACDDCEKLRKTSKNAYRALCESCVQKGKSTSEETKAISSAKKKGANNSNFGKRCEDVFGYRGGCSRKKHRARVVEWLKLNDVKKYEIVLCVLAEEQNKDVLE